jgi:hypothetical protein
MKEPTKQATAADLLELLRKQSHFLTNSLPPIPKHTIERMLACDSPGFETLMNELMLRESKAVTRLIARCAVVTGKTLDEIGKYFYLGHRLKDHSGEFGKAFETITVDNGGKVWQVVNMDPNKFEEEWQVMNSRTKRLPADYLIGSDATLKRPQLKAQRGMRFDPALDEMLQIASAAANVTQTHFVETLIRHYSDSVLRSYIHTMKDDDRKNALNLYGTLRKRYGSIASFKDLPEPKQVDAKRYGPHSPKYEPKQSKIMKLPFSVIRNKVLGLASEEIMRQRESNKRQQDIAQLQEDMAAKPEDQFSDEEKHQFWLRYAVLEGKVNPRQPSSRPKVEADNEAEAVA